MKKFLSALLLIFTVSQASSQVSCNSFCITGIEMDSIQPGMLNVTIFMSGSNSDFANYPYPELMTTLTGDTLATGFMNFFGQIGNSSQDYPMYTSLDSIPANLQAVIYFNYDTVQCVLNFPCVPAGLVSHEGLEAAELYPNPAKEMIFMKLPAALPEDTEIQVWNSAGMKITPAVEPANGKLQLNFSGYPSGIYYIRTTAGDKNYFNKVIVRP